MNPIQAERVLEISRQLASTHSLEALLHQIVEVAADLTGSESAGLLLFNEVDHQLHFVAVTTYEDLLLDIPVPLHHSIAGAAFLSNRPENISNARADSRYFDAIEKKSGFKGRSLLAVPLTYQEHKIGVLEVENKRSSTKFDQADIDVLTDLAIQAALAIENARMIETLRKHNQQLEALVETRMQEIVNWQKRFELVATAASLVIYAHEIDQDTLVWSGSLEQVFGYQPSELNLGLAAWLQLLDPAESTEVIHLREQAKKNHQPYLIEYHWRHKTGQLLNVRDQGFFTYDAHGRATRMLGMLQDQTERKRLEAQISHQQRELTIISEREEMGRELHDGLGQILSYLSVENQTADLLIEQGELEAVHSALKRMENVTQNAQTRLRRYILGLRTSPPPSQGLFGTLAEALQEMETSLGLKTSLSLPSTTPEPLFSPAVEEQAFYLLQEGLSNIRKHARAQRVDVQFSLIGGIVQLLIADDGCGFNPAEVDAQKHFGLTIMHERARNAGGQLEIRSAPGAGTRLLVSLPCLGTALEDMPESAIFALQRLRILLVDDSPLFLEGLRNLLIARGVQVVGLAGNGREAYEQASRFSPDVVLMDLRMPEGGGLEAIQRIKAELPKVQIIMLTVSELEDDLFAALRSGASGYLLKNLSADKLCQHLADWARGQAPLTPSLASSLVAEFSSAGHSNNQRLESLTPHQWAVLKLVSQGSTYHQAAEQLHLSEATVKYHMGKILERLHLKNREQAIRYARRRLSISELSE